MSTDPTSNRAAPSAIRLDLVQIGRGWAALLVVLFHADAIIHKLHAPPFLGGFFDMGGTGVDFFFVLSGFLICRLHLKDIGRPAAIGPFVRKRFCRIYPVYWIATLLILPAFFLAPSLGRGIETQPSVIVGSLLLLPSPKSPILVAGWTLRHELFFYFLFGLLIAGSRRWVFPMIGLWVASLLTVTTATAIRSYDFPNDYVQLAFWPQNLEFVMGCLSAMLIARCGPSISRRWCTIALPIGFLAFHCVPDFPHQQNMASGRHVLVYGLMSMVMITAAARIDETGGVGERARSNPVYRFALKLGDASYAIYLVHGPVLSLAFKLLQSRGLVEKLGSNVAASAATVAAILGGLLFHIAVELPVLKAFRRR